ncbi:helix-turn-helix transcriptional regulator [Pandoraea terrae]|uniref:Helix-turn-helix transcriptional regulator n=2 Tax=Pandoraea terrae TaxID=1537710 RepID=A0A5E4WG65_9BURK|nr:helix-turn-helix transcriptional regulator [Pandoraea terrae]
MRLIDALFACTLENPPWVSFLEAMEQYIPCHHATLVLRKPRSGDPGVLVTLEGHADAIVALQERVFEASPFLELPEGEVCILSRMMSEAELADRHPGYYEYLHTYGQVTDLIGLDLAEPVTGMIFRLRGARREGEPRFGEREQKILEALAPRLRTAFAIYARFAHQQYQLSVLDDAAEQLAVGCLVLSQDGRVLLKNAVADRWLAQQDGFRLWNGVVRCLDPQSERLLRTTLAAAAASEGPGDAARSFRIRRGGERHWSVLVRPYGVRAALGEKTASAVLLLVRDADQKPEVSAGVLVELFGLTRAEAVLAARLTNGESLTEAAQSLDISRYTARAQLSAVFAKTDTHRQPQLVSHILNTVNSVWA